MPTPLSVDRDEIAERLIAGATPYSLRKLYPQATVYRIYNELKAEGRIGGGIEPPPVLTTSTKQTKQSIREAASLPGVDLVEPKEPSVGQKTLPTDVLTQVRGILGILAKPKVLTMPTPELLYPAMVISIEEWGWPPMRPDNFIDTVLDKFISATGIEHNVYIRKDQLDDMVKFAQEHGYKFKKEEGNDGSGRTQSTGQESGDSRNNSGEATGDDRGGEGIKPEGDIGGPPI